MFTLSPAYPAGVGSFFAREEPLDPFDQGRLRGVLIVAAGAFDHLAAGRGRAVLAADDPLLLAKLVSAESAAHVYKSVLRSRFYVLGFKVPGPFQGPCCRRERSTRIPYHDCQSNVERRT